MSKTCLKLANSTTVNKKYCKDIFSEIKKPISSLIFPTKMYVRGVWKMSIMFKVYNNLTTCQNYHQHKRLLSVLIVSKFRFFVSSSGHSVIMLILTWVRYFWNLGEESMKIWKMNMKNIHSKFCFCYRLFTSVLARRSALPRTEL